MKHITLKKRMIFIGVLSTVAIIILGLTTVMGYKGSFLHGFSVGLLAVVLPVLIFLIFRYHNKEYQKEFDLSLQDERIKRNYERAGAVAFKIQSVLIIAVAIVSVLFEVEIYFMVLAIIFVMLVFTKIYSNKLNSRGDF